MKKSLGIPSLVSILLLALALAGGCGGENDAAAAPEAPVEREPGAEAEPAQAAEEEPGPVAEDPTFELRAEAQGPYTAGEQGTFEIRLTPRGEYHVNQEFPMNVSLTAPEGVELAQTQLGNDDAAELGEERARFAVPFTAASAGEHRVTAEVDFAVCTPEACMPDRRTLALVLPVR